MATEGQPTDDQTTSMERLRARQQRLQAQAEQLQARADHLKRVGRSREARLRRRQDAHEKIVLGALVKKAGLDSYRLPPTDDSATEGNDDVLSPSSLRVDAIAATYDRALLLAALQWLYATMESAQGQEVRVPVFGHDDKRTA